MKKKLNPRNAQAKYRIRQQHAKSRVAAASLMALEPMESRVLMTTVTTTDAGGTYTGSPYPATALVNGAASQGGVTPTVAVSWV